MVANLTEPISVRLPQWLETDFTAVTVGNKALTIDDVASVARNNSAVRLTDREEILQGVQDSSDYIADAVESGKSIYGVTTGFGGMAGTAIAPEEAARLQNNLVRYHKAGAGKCLPLENIRAAMLLRITAVPAVMRYNQ